MIRRRDFTALPSTLIVVSGVICSVAIAVITGQNGYWVFAVFAAAAAFMQAVFALLIATS